MDSTVDWFASPPEVMRQLPGYRILRIISQTAMSSVYLAEDRTLPRRVVLKVMNPNLAGDPGFRRRFTREVGIAAGLDHPNIVPVYASGDVNGTVYLVLRHVNGGDLGQVIRDQGRLGLARAGRIVGQVAAALDAAHEAGLVHRDVKPGNILIDTADHVYLCDFGIAKVESAASLTTAGQFLGTMDYAAPEQFSSGRIDRRTDVYALGAVLYQCLTGEKPFPHREPSAVLWAHLHKAPPKVTHSRPDLAPAIDDVVATAMAKRPEERFATCGHLAAALPGQAVRAAGPVRGFTRTHKLILAALAVLVLVAGAVALMRPWAADPATLARVPAAVRGACERAGDAAGPPLPAASLSCRASGQVVLVGLYDSDAGLARAYDQALREANVRREQGDCSNKSGAEHRYPNVGAPQGRLLCFEQNAAAWLVWTDDRQKTLARMRGRTADVLKLQQAWVAWTKAPGFPAKPEQEIMSLVGQTDCKRAEAGTLDQFRDVVAGVVCTPTDQGVDDVAYYRFASLDGLRRSHAGQVARIKAPKKYCVNEKPAKFLGHSTYDNKSVRLGEVLCHKQGTPVVEWTVEPLLLMGQATGKDAEDLGTWWEESRDPSSATVIKAANAQATPPFPTEEEQALLARVPEASKVNCLRPTPEQVKSNVREAKVIAVACGPTAGAGVVFYYQYGDAATMRRNYAADAPDGGPCDRGSRTFRGDGPYTIGGKVAGHLLCGESGSGETYLSWTNEKLKIQVFAFNTLERGVLLDWWRKEAGPIS
ncbi:serine/threonine-protein kinase [Nonomuraea typhae]|uniref:serine/threonine-protein kinase n=1 Tax=Nonomuraea typhae TaxID=2603600 RepID=UPI0015E1CB62|nr:serine/threonine-protein kinase [Nonomuraea typhae]